MFAHETCISWQNNWIEVSSKIINVLCIANILKHKCNDDLMSISWGSGIW